MIFCNLYPLATEKTIMYINEAGSWSSNRFERVTYYCIDTSDAANGNVELQELFSCDEYDYNSNKASERWK